MLAPLAAFALTGALTAGLRAALELELASVSAPAGVVVAG